MKLTNEMQNRIEWLGAVADREGDSRVDPNWLAIDEAEVLKRYQRKVKAMEDAVEKAKRLTDRLTESIENMELDCDYEVYDGLCRIWKALDR